VHLGDTVNSRAMEWTPCISADGLELYFAQGPWGNTDIVVTKRKSVSEPWGAPENLGPIVNSTSWDMGPSITADGLELFFCSTRAGGFGGPDLYVTTRATVSDPWGPPVNLGPTVNTSYGNSLYGEWTPSISQDGLALFFASARPPGSASNLDIWLTIHATRQDAWEPPIHLGSLINNSGHDSSPCISADGRMLYFVSDRPGGVGGDSDFWQVAITPVADFNADGKVDLVDLVMLIDDWGKNKSVCDIGPMPWGDGKVDIEDLKVFMTYYEKENPPKSNDGK
jgi:Tol biopolymer transport system component